MDVIYTGSKTFEINFERNIEPGIINIFDLNFQKDGSTNMAHKCHLKVASSKDMGFMIDSADFVIKGSKNNSSNYEIDLEQEIKYYIESNEAIAALHSKWPYISMGGLESSTVLIFNVYSIRSKIITIPRKQDKILSTFITNKNNLYILT